MHHRYKIAVVTFLLLGILCINVKSQSKIDFYGELLTGSWKVTEITAVSNGEKVLISQKTYFDTLRLGTDEQYQFRWGAGDTLENGSWNILSKGKIILLYNRKTSPAHLAFLPVKKFSIEVLTKDRFVIIEKDKIESRFPGRPTEMQKIVYRTYLTRIN